MSSTLNKSLVLKTEYNEGSSTLNQIFHKKKFLIYEESYRWIILLVQCMLNYVVGFNLLFFSSILSIRDYLDLSVQQSYLVLLIGLLPFVVLYFPISHIITNKPLSFTLNLLCMSLIIGSFLRIFNGFSYFFSVAAQFFIGISSLFTYNINSKVVNLWFCSRMRLSSYCILTFMKALGFASSFLFFLYFEEKNEKNHFLWIDSYDTYMKAMLGLSVLVYIVILLFFKYSPSAPPSLSSLIIQKGLYYEVYIEKIIESERETAEKQKNFLTEDEEKDENNEKDTYFLSNIQKIMNGNNSQKDDSKKMSHQINLVKTLFSNNNFNHLSFIFLFISQIELIILFLSSDYLSIYYSNWFILLFQFCFAFGYSIGSLLSGILGFYSNFHKFYIPSSLFLCLLSMFSVNFIKNENSLFLCMIFLVFGTFSSFSSLFIIDFSIEEGFPVDETVCSGLVFSLSVMFFYFNVGFVYLFLYVFDINAFKMFYWMLFGYVSFGFLLSIKVNGCLNKKKIDEKY